MFMRSHLGLGFPYWILLCIPLLAVAGCGGKFKLGQVEGTVTLDGKPLGEAAVAFTPLAAGPESPASSGLTDSAGKYRLSLVIDQTSGAIVGKHKVVVSKGFESSSDIATPQERARAALPDHDFSFEVKSGSNKADFNLETRKGKK
jgi:hypothetical protein